MTLRGLEVAAVRAELLGLANVQLVFPPRWKAPAGFPRREVACVNSKGDTVAWVKAKRLLAWVRAQAVPCSGCGELLVPGAPEGWRCPTCGSSETMPASSETGAPVE